MGYLHFYVLLVPQGGGVFHTQSQKSLSLLNTSPISEKKKGTYMYNDTRDEHIKRKLVGCVERHEFSNNTIKLLI